MILLYIWYKVSAYSIHNVSTTHPLLSRKKKEKPSCNCSSASPLVRVSPFRFKKVCWKPFQEKIRNKRAKPIYLPSLQEKLQQQQNNRKATTQTTSYFLQDIKKKVCCNNAYYTVYVCKSTLIFSYLLHEPAFCFCFVSP